MSGFEDFDRYCDEHGIQPGEEPAAFAAWLHERTGWDGSVGQLEVAGADTETSDLGVRAVRPDLERAPETEAGGAAGHAPSVPGAAEERVLGGPHAAGTPELVRTSDGVGSDPEDEQPADGWDYDELGEVDRNDVERYARGEEPD